ncbi:FHA domain-containing protein [Ilumatobacter nonamiensis]|uniref:FHA domain-containing protein n=1 Tax=Ilumatobacter nonamiensis TaxID=467093 RepID=UPI000686F6B6|nr:FHA domain-containing protein [Ilumatobacter nonamiensis]
MSDQVLNILKLSLLGLLYIFFARVLWAVWSEVKSPRPRPVARTQQPGGGGTAPQPRPATATRNTKPAKGRGGKAARIVVLEPKHRRGTAVALDNEITLGRDDSCTISIQDDSFVSTLHLRVYDYDGQPMVEDLGSTNGTFHNGTRLHGSKLLQPGDRVQVGTTVFEAQ